MAESRPSNPWEEKPWSLQKNRPFLVAVDFDDTIRFGDFRYKYTWTLNIVVARKIAETLKAHPDAEFILWTCRANEGLEDAKWFIKEHKLPIYLFNEQHPYVLKTIPESKHWRKILADEYWDDKAVHIEKQATKAV